MNLSDSLQDHVKGLYPDYLGIIFTEASPDCIKAELRGRDEICTLPSTIHGGALVGLADTLGTFATVLNMEGNSRTTTLESKTNFFRRVEPSKKITPNAPRSTKAVPRWSGKQEFSEKMTKQQSSSPKHRLSLLHRPTWHTLAKYTPTPKAVTGLSSRNRSGVHFAQS